VTWTVTFSGGTPSSFAADVCASLGACVPTRISHLPSRKSAKQFIGSTGACAWNEKRYSASSRREAGVAASAFSASPTARVIRARGAVSASLFQYVSVESLRFSPSSQTTFRASRPFKAAHVSLATTAMPVDSCTTSRTPGIARAGAASKDEALPPGTGHRTTHAVSAPSGRASSP
jgi:hypothetical protein